MRENRNQQRRSNGIVTEPKKSDKRASFRVFIILFVLFLNIVNIIFYNTGWLSFSKDTWDIMWSTALFCLNVTAGSFALFLGNENIEGIS